MKRVCFFCTMMESGCLRAAWSLTRHAANHAAAQRHHASHACNNSPAGVDKEARRLASSAARRPDRPAYCRRLDGWATLQDGCVRDDTWETRPSLVEADSNYTRVLHVGGSHCPYAVSGHNWQRAAKRLPWRGREGGPEKLETQKRGPSGLDWLRVQMPCRGS